jgi:TRAP-type C4-dicarboxylate transport system permease small subunit
VTPPAILARFVRLADRGLGALVRAARWLAVPLAVLLFLQWPLRDWVQAYSREANDFAQVLFAFYVAVAFTAATRSGAHLAVETTRADPRRRARRARLAAALVVLPATLGLAWVAAAPVWRSVSALEAFPETYNPGYFALKVALATLTLAALAQALVDVFRMPGER